MIRKFHFDIPKNNKALEEFSKGKPFLQIERENLWDEGFEAKPIDGYEEPENFPNCCLYHESVFENVTKWFDTFPDCCETHRKIKSRYKFNRDNFSHVPKKVLRQLSYTEYFIGSRIDADNWYKDMTDYITYNLHSFGTPNIGGNWYFDYLEYYIKEAKQLPVDKRKRLLEYLDNQNNPPSKQKTDLNILYSTFQKWLKTFPDLIFFKNLKTQLTNKLPLKIMLYEPEHNTYLGLTRYKLKTQGELVEMLIESTKKLLNEVNTPGLVEKGQISDSSKHQIDLINESHRVKQNQLLKDYSKKEIKYVKIIKRWLQNEKDYFVQVAPLLKSLSYSPNIMFEIERREVFDKEYLKVFIRSKDEINEVCSLISSLQSVKRANITENEETDITVYPSKTYSVEEAQIEVQLALEAYFSKGALDPIFSNSVISAISDKAYFEIMDRIIIYGQNLEKYRSLYSKFDEEGFREFFLPHLNSISESHSATGETFNKAGKTDILIQDGEGKNVFIAECKLWKGESELSKAVDQLLNRYVTWRDEKTALIIFNKDMKGFSELLTKAVEQLKSHSLFDTYLGNRRDTSFSFTFKHPDDDKRKLKLELIIFNCT